MEKEYLAEYDGYKYLTTDHCFYDHIIRGQSEPYPHDLAIVKKYLYMFPHKNRTYIDVGAHIGTTILPYSKIFTRIIGYEPFNYDYLEKNIKLNNIQNVEINKCAIYEHNCKGDILKHGSNSGCYYFKENEAGQISCESLDNEMKNKNIENVDFLKIDTEGSELFILKGGLELIKKYKPFIQLECNGLSEKLYNIKEQEIREFLSNLGYIPFNIRHGNKFFYCPNDSLNITPRTVFCFWTGANSFTQKRMECMIQLDKTISSEVKLIGIKKLDNYILDAYPLHEAYQYLSDVHKADYLRMYFMHFYGGGYTDIKKQTDTWEKPFDIIINNKHLYGVGYPEIEGGVACKEFEHYYNLLIGNGAYIFRPYTEFTKKWYDKVHKLLDNNLERLKKYPAIEPRDCKEKRPEYPIEWNEMLGRIFHKLNYEFKEKFSRDLKPPIFNNYY